MAGAILLIGAIVWLLAGVAAVALAAVATPALEAALPPLAIDTDALRGTVLALGVGLLLVGLLHLGVVGGLRARRGWSSSAGILLAASLAATMIGLGASAAASAAATPDRAPALVAAAAAATIGAVGYAVAANRLVVARRSGAAP